MINYSIFYFLCLIAFLEQFTNINFRLKKYLILFTLLVFVFLSTIYHGGAGDYHTYEGHFLAISSSRFDFKLLNTEDSFEPFYVILAFITKNFSDQYWAFRLVLSCIVMSIWYKIYTYRHNVLIRKHVFLILLAMWAIQMGPIFIVRSTIAMTICLYSLKYIEHMNSKKFALCTLFAMGFHTMAILWFLAYRVYWNWKVRTTETVCLIMSISAIALKDIIANFFLSIAWLAPTRIAYRLNSYVNDSITTTYGSSYSYATVVVKGLANMLVLFVLLRYLYMRFLRLNDEVNLYFNGYYKIFLFGIMLFSIALPINLTFARAALPFTTISAFLLPCAFDLPENRRNYYNRFCLFAIYSVYLFTRMYGNLALMPLEFETIFSY